MEDNKNKEDKVTKKLTFNNSKLTLGKSSYNNKNLSRKVNSPASNVVVEVKRGKAMSSGVAQESESTNSTTSESQLIRRLSVLQKARDDNKEKNNISTLSKIVGMNQTASQSAINRDNPDNDKSNDKKIILKNSNNDSNNIKTPPQTKESTVVKSKKSDISVKNDEKTKETTSKKDKDNKDNESHTVEKSRDSKEKGNKEKQSESSSKKQKPEETRSAAKLKNTAAKKIKKSDIFYMLSEDSGDIQSKTRSLASIERAKAKQKRKNTVAISDKKQDKIYREVIVPEIITVAELSSRMTEKVTDVMRELMKLGVMATANQSIDADTAELIIGSFGHSIKRIKESDVENILYNEKDKKEDLLPRAPIVTVMGHVDHGKTSLLDALKATDIASNESGGITQHIGAYSVTMSDNKMITFIDTPGHEAFTEMRIRGAKATDIVVLVVAADDGIKPQTVEAINHAKAAKVPIIVAINKIDKPDANIEKTKNELLQYELISEDLGGDTIVVPVSAKEKTNLEQLEKAILLVAEIEDLRANPNANASGVVIESRLHKGEGVITSLLVQRGTLKHGDLIVTGTNYGRIKKMRSDKGRLVRSVTPSHVVEMFGLNNTPLSGDLFNIVNTEKQAKDITEYRIRKLKENKVTASKSSLENLFLEASGNSKVKQLSIILKGDVHGSIEAINSNLNKIVSDEIKLKIIHQAVGGITESDVTLAKATGAMIIGFNVRSNSGALAQSQKHNIDVRYYSIIYNLIADIKSIMSGMLSPIIREIYIGSVEIREVFNISKVGKIAGSYVTKGIIKRGAGVRLLRDNIVVHEGTLKTLKRFKEDEKEVREGYECGIAFENYDDIKTGDLIEVFEIVKEQKQL